MGEDTEEKQINIDIMEENSEDIAKITDIMEQDEKVTQQD